MRNEERTRWPGESRGSNKTGEPWGLSTRGIINRSTSSYLFYPCLSVTSVVISFLLTLQDKPVKACFLDTLLCLCPAMYPPSAACGRNQSAKHKIRNKKTEIRNKSECLKFEFPKQKPSLTSERRKVVLIFGFMILNLFRVSDFVLRNLRTARKF